MNGWLAVIGYEGRYEVSSLGEVRSAKTGLPIKRVVATDGYLAVSLFDGQRARTKPVHVLVAAAFIGERPAGLQINHISGDKMNNARDNLEYCSRAENMRHAVRLGLTRGMKGTFHPRAKLTDAEAAAIRGAVGSLGAIAKRFGVNKSTIWKIKRGMSWSHLSASFAVGG